MTALHYRLLAVTWTVLILLALTVPMPSPPSVDPGGIGLDKIVHFALFFGFGLLWMHGLHRRRPSRGKRTSIERAAVLLLVGLVLSILTEWIQSHLAYRSGEVADVIANVLGLATAIGYFMLRHPPSLPGK